VRTVFFGSGGFAVPILEVLAREPRVRIVGVVTAPDRPAGRGGQVTATPVARRARELELRVLQPARVRDSAAAQEISSLAPELGVLADYGQIVPQAILDLPRLGILNIHPSPLPRHRGASPIQATIAEGDDVAGVSIIRMDDGIDTGPIVAQQDWMLAGSERTPELEAEAAREGASLLRRTLGSWLEGQPQPRPQPATTAPPTRPFRRADARLDPSLPARSLERQVRARVPWPGSFVETEAGRLAVIRASVAASSADDQPARLVRHDDGLALTTADGRLVLDEVQLAGRRAMRGEAFLRGHPGLAGTPVVEERAAVGAAG